MKHFICYSLLVLSLSLFSEAVAPDYYITKSKEDKTLKKTEAVFVFTFLDSQDKSINETITFSYNGVNKNEKPNTQGELSLTVKPGKYLFNFFLNTEHYEITTDSLLIKPGYRNEIRVHFKNAERPAIMKKPVIYVYPEKKKTVSIKLDLQGEFLFTYPEYKNGWEFTAEPNGTLHMNDKQYHYLFWDGKVNIKTSALNLKEGFVVEKKDLVNFLEEKLHAMGLNAQETEDYITYWCPVMNKNEKNYIHFIFNESYNDYASIQIDPKPDNLFRVCMLWSKANDNVLIREQKIETFKREGFTVVEWGGAELNDLSIDNNEL